MKEYKVVSTDDTVKTVTEILNAMAEQGWNFVQKSGGLLIFERYTD